MNPTRQGTGAMKPKTDSENKNYLSFWRKIAFGFSGSAENLMQNSINNMANPIFNIVLGVNPALISLAIFISRIWDAFTDPTMGAISDNTRGRFGRRKPYMLVGGIMASLIFVLLWRIPAGLSSTGYFIWFLVGSLMFYTFYTIFSVPCVALSYELSPEYNERTRIIAYRSVFAGTMGIAMPWMYRLTQLERFDNPLDGMHTVSIGVASLMLLGSMIPTFFTKERLARSVSHQKKNPLLSSLKTTLKNRNFRLLVGMVIFSCLGLFMVGQLGVYVNIYYVYGGDKLAASTMLGIGGTLYGLAGGILAAPLVSLVSARIGKKKTLLYGLMLAAVGTATKFFTYNIEWPALQLISLLLMSPGLSCMWILSPSIMADIADEDEWNTGSRREGMYGAVFSNVMKIGVSIGLLAVGFILNATGFDVALGGAQSSGTLLAMRLCFTLIPFCGLSIAVLLVGRLDISKARALEIRRLLDERHAAAEASAT